MPPVRRLIVLLKVLGVFALMGPPVGALTFFVAIGLYGAVQTGDAATLLWVTLFGFIYAVPLSYLIGIVPALSAGLILGVVAIVHRPPGILGSIMVGTAVGIGVGSEDLSLLAPGNVPASDYALAAIPIMTCLVATVSCWAVARWMFARPDAPIPQPAVSPHTGA
jgi:hypothetical protein